MKLLIVRHADAGTAEEFAQTGGGQPDHLRPLSKKGRKQIVDAAEGLRALVPSADLIVTSPYVRAVQTAEALRDAYAPVREEVSATLEPDVAPAAFSEWLRDHETKDVVIAVGHEPHLSSLITWLLCGTDDSRVEMKKSGACLLVFDDAPKKGSAMLRWLMGAKQLQQLGGA